MAARKTDILHVAVVVLSMLAVGLGVTTFLGYDSAADQRLAAEAARKQAGESDRKFDTENLKNQLLEWMIGERELSDAERQEILSRLESDEQVKRIKTRFDEDMQLFQGSSAALGTPEGWNGPQNWSSLPDYLVHVVQKRNQEWNDEKKRADRMEAEKGAMIEKHLAAAQQAESGRQKAEEQLLAANETLQQDRSKSQSLHQSLQSQVNTANAKADKLQKETNRQVAELQSKLTNAENLQEEKSEEVRNLQRKDYDVPHGLITYVNQRTRTAYIDLGLADGLKRQQTFSVYDRDETNHSKAEPKASIEVMKVLDEHMAEARILDDDLSNPIMTEDFIYTPAWAPGRRLHFALTGWMEFNDDDKSDRQLVKNLIYVNGGIVDAEVDDEGQRSGKITVHTRYLIHGEEPSDEAINSHTQIMNDAEELGVEKVSVYTFLGWMGYRGEISTKAMDRRGAATGGNEPQFQPRRPPASAY